jgi:hypothetical protein
MRGKINRTKGEIFCSSCKICLGDWDWEGAGCSETHKIKPSFRILKSLLLKLAKDDQRVLQYGCAWSQVDPVVDVETPTSTKKGTSNRFGGLLARIRKDEGTTSPRAHSAPDLEIGNGKNGSKNQSSLSSSGKKKLSDSQVKGKEGQKNSSEPSAGSSGKKNSGKSEKSEKSSSASFSKNENGGDGNKKKSSDNKKHHHHHHHREQDNQNEDGSPTTAHSPRPSSSPSEGKDKEASTESEGPAAAASGGKNQTSNQSTSASTSATAPSTKGGGLASKFGLDRWKKRSSKHLEEDEEKRLEEMRAGKNDPPLQVSTPEDLPPTLKKLVKAAKIDDEDIAANFLILLNCLHFLTKRAFVYTPGEGEEPINIGNERGSKAKQKRKIPKAEELVSDASMIKKELKIQEAVGEGGFGRVYLARNLKAKGKVAVKKMKHVGARDQQRNLCEIDFLRRVDHPNIVKYMCSYIVDDDIWVVTEYMEGGTLTEAIRGYDFEEKHIAYVAKEMLKGIKYLHSNGLVHRDLKSANIMMTTEGDVKLIDFGLCLDLRDEGQKKHMVGSPFWMPPEMIKRQVYGPEVDIWSGAICLLELANGEPPNRKSALKAMFVAGTEGYPAPFRNPNAWSDDFKSFISLCLETEPEKRPKAEQLLTHPFLRKADTKRGMKKILSHIFLQNTMEMMNLGGFG